MRYRTGRRGRRRKSRESWVIETMQGWIQGGKEELHRKDRRRREGEPLVSSAASSPLAKTVAVRRHLLLLFFVSSSRRRWRRTPGHRSTPRSGKRGECRGRWLCGRTQKRGEGPAGRQGGRRRRRSNGRTAWERTSSHSLPLLGFLSMWRRRRMKMGVVVKKGLRVHRLVDMGGMKHRGGGGRRVKGGGRPHGAGEPDRGGGRGKKRRMCHRRGGGEGGRRAKAPPFWALQYMLADGTGGPPHTRHRQP